MSLLLLFRVFSPLQQQVTLMHSVQLTMSAKWKDSWKRLQEHSKFIWMLTLQRWKKRLTTTTSRNGPSLTMVITEPTLVTGTSMELLIVGDIQQMLKKPTTLIQEATTSVLVTSTFRSLRLILDMLASISLLVTCVLNAISRKRLTVATMASTIVSIRMVANSSLVTTLSHSQLWITAHLLAISSWVNSLRATHSA